MKKFLPLIIAGTVLFGAQRDNEWNLIPHQPPGHKSIRFGNEPDGSTWVEFEVDPSAPSTNALWYTLTNIYTGETRLIGPILAVQGKPARPGTLRIVP